MEFTYSVNKANALSLDKEMELLLSSLSIYIKNIFISFSFLPELIYIRNIFIFETSPLSTKEGTRKEQLQVGEI
jgi:hypothetical protein